MINNQTFIYKEVLPVFFPFDRRLEFFQGDALVNQTDSNRRKRFSSTVEADQGVKVMLLCSA